MLDNNGYKISVIDGVKVTEAYDAINNWNIVRLDAKVGQDDITVCDVDVSDIPNFVSLFKNMIENYKPA